MIRSAISVAALATALTAPLVSSTARADGAVPDRQIGVMIDGGLPDGANGSLVYRPDRQLRFHIGGGYNLIGPGVRAGLTARTSPAWFSPTVTFEGGHYFRGDANDLVQMFDANAEEISVLESVGYSYGNLHLGIELGRDRFSWFVQAGGSVLKTRVVGLEQALDDDPTEGGPHVVAGDDPSVLVFMVSARTGVVVFF